MPAENVPDLINSFDVSKETLQAVVAETLARADDGDLFLEHSEAETLMFDNGRLKTGSYSTGRGFGLRAVAGEAVGYAEAGELCVGGCKDR